MGCITQIIYIEIIGGNTYLGYFSKRKIFFPIPTPIYRIGENNSNFFSFLQMRDNKNRPKSFPKCYAATFVE